MQVIDRFEIEVEFFEDAEFTAFTLQAGTRQVALETARTFCRASSGVRKATIYVNFYDEDNRQKFYEIYPSGREYLYAYDRHDCLKPDRIERVRIGKSNPA